MDVGIIHQTRESALGNVFQIDDYNLIHTR